MMTPTKILMIMASVVLVVGGIVWYVYRDSEFKIEIDTNVNLSKIFTRNGVEWTTYQNEELGVTFSYRLAPDGYVAVTPTDLPQGTLLAVSLFKESEYLELLESSVAREAPPAITLEVFSSDGAGTVEEWIKKNKFSNFALATDQPVKTFIGGLTGSSYPWSGLYESLSAVVIHGYNVYVFSVQYFTPTDKIISDFAEFIGTVKFK